MDRRSFLTVLGAVGILTGAPRWLLDPIMREKLASGLELPDDDDVSEWLAPSDLAVYGRGLASTCELFATHDGTSGSGFAQVDVLRLPENGGGTVLTFRLGPGQMLRWCAAPGEEIYGPVKIVSPDVVQTRVVGTNAQGRLMFGSKAGIGLFTP